ncbi:DUF6233 domain-containing protein [Streptomyces sp. NPDC048330]|uniref:DUF6233 domain-containing protein n=1 Tax=Streptomyces sp. NPDC048330 TaxID=3365533 RepID=UPI003714974D
MLPVDGVAYDDVPIERPPAPPGIERMPGLRRPSGWALEYLGGRRGREQAVVHAIDCAELPANAPRLSPAQALAAAKRRGVRLCWRCGAFAALDPVLRGCTDGSGTRTDGDLH